MKLSSKLTAAAAAAIICMSAGTACLSMPAAAGSPIPAATVEYGSSNKKTTLSDMKKYLYVPECGLQNVSVLKKSKTVKDCLIIDRQERLVIPKGKTLKLKGGADIAGTIYIEKGGKLLIDKWSVSLSGNIVCFGTISVTDGTLACSDGSMMFIAKGGKFKASDGSAEINGELNGRVIADSAANIVCLGTCNIPDPTFAGTPVSAVYTRSEFGGSTKKTSVVTDGLSDLMKVKFNKDDPYWAADFADIYTILFSGGGCLTLTAGGNTDNGWSMINEVELGAFNHVLADYRNPDNEHYDG